MITPFISAVFFTSTQAFRRRSIGKREAEDRENYLHLHRLLSDKGLFSKVAIEWDFPITFEMARAYQKSKGKYLREYQWQDMSMAVRIEFGK